MRDVRKNYGETQSKSYLKKAREITIPKFNPNLKSDNFLPTDVKIA
jgi:hypothetical protein